MPDRVKDYCTIDELMKALDAPRRAVFRALARAEAAGHTVRERILGRSAVIKAAIPVIKQHYYPYYSEAHQANVREWGRLGGAAKARNLRRRDGASGKPGGRAGG
jgi:hypothetical protein